MSHHSRIAACLQRQWNLTKLQMLCKKSKHSPSNLQFKRTSACVQRSPIASNWQPDIRQLSHSFCCKFLQFIQNEFNGSLNMETSLLMEMLNYKFQRVSSMLSTVVLLLNHLNAKMCCRCCSFLFHTSVNKAFCVSLTLWRVALTQISCSTHCHCLNVAT